MKQTAAKILRENTTNYLSIRQFGEYLEAEGYKNTSGNQLALHNAKACSMQDRDDLLEACKYALESTYIDADDLDLALEALSDVRSALSRAIAKAESD